MATIINNKKQIDDFLISEDIRIIDGIKKLNKTKKKILFVINKNKKLIGSLSDGDLRFGLQKNFGLKEKIKKFCNRKIKFFYKKQIKKINFENLKYKDIRYIPITNTQKKIIEIIHLSTLTKKSINTPFVIIAGGIGKRLLPLTESMPKPMVKINNKPIMEHIIDKAISEGFQNFIISTGYLGNKIKKYFGNGKKKDIVINYINEKKPLGTGGFLFYLKKFKYNKFFISNGDVLTKFSYKDLLNFHNLKNSQATITAISKSLKFPFGEIISSKDNFIHINEKPLIEKFINCGLYVVNKSSLKVLKKNKYIEMPDFFNLLKAQKKKTKVFSIYESWTDITNSDDVQYLDKKVSNFYDF